jgi:3-hydroxyisobutyrate dehydrogenase-like beta-hydroxyacid dehydrogenase
MKAVALGENGLIEAAAPGKALIDMSSIAAVSEAMVLAKKAGCGAGDHSSIVKFYEKLANIEVTRKAFRIICFLIVHKTLK